MRRPGRRETFTDNCVNAQTLNVYCHAVNHVPVVAGQPQKKGLRPIVKVIKSVKAVSCGHQLSSVQPVINVHTVAWNRSS